MEDAEEDWKDNDYLSLENNASDEEDDDDDGSMEMSSDNSTAGEAFDSSGVPPWIEDEQSSLDNRNNNRRIMHPLTLLHNEIVGFCRLMEPTPEETRKREALVEEVKVLVKKTFQDERADVQVFGSQATGLFLPTSDIDIVIITGRKKQEDNAEATNAASAGEPKEDDLQEDWDKPSGSPLHRFAAAIREEWRSELSYLEVLDKTRIPLVKFTHAPTNISVDISFDETSGPPAATLMKTYMDALPPLRPLTFVIKYFLVARALNEPYSGGVGSFMLQLMIVAFLQHRERDAVNFQRPSICCLGSLLLEFFELYGYEFNYLTTGLSVRHDGFFFPKGANSRKEIFWNPDQPFSCALENPLDPTMDTGKSSFRIQMVQRAFSVAYKMLLSHVAEPAVVPPTPSILATILRPTEEMVSRRWYKRRVRPLSAKRGTSSPEVARGRKRQRF